VEAESGKERQSIFGGVKGKVPAGEPLSGLELWVHLRVIAPGAGDFSSPALPLLRHGRPVVARAKLEGGSLGVTADLQGG